MTSPDQPAWELLPHDPTAFFGLEAGFDRRDLKRKYNGFLRQFKPEKFPAEFQKIRAAFEELDAQLRYGQDVAGPTQVSEEWLREIEAASQSLPAEVINSQPASSDAVEAEIVNVPVVRPIAERLADEPVSDLFQEVRDKQDKSAYDFYTLAVLSDVLAKPDDDNSLVFLQWLLTGLKAHPDSAALFRLVQVFIGKRVQPRDMGRVLLAVSKVVSSDRFYFLTERLWEKLLGHIPFGKFQPLLEKCEANLRDYRIHSKIAFYVHLLRRALFKAPPEWIQQVTNFIEQNHEHLSEDSEYELECTSRIQDYLSIRTVFLNGHPIRQMMDRTIRDYCTLESIQADQSVVMCQNYIAAHSTEMFEAFPLNDREEVSEILPAWFWVTEEVRQRLDLAEQHELEPATVYNAIGNMMLEYDAGENHTGWQMIEWAHRLGHLAMGVACFATPFLILSMFMSSPGYILPSIVLGIAALIFYGVYLHRVTVSAMIDKMQEKKIESGYRDRGRAEIARFFNATHYPFRAVVDIMEAMLNKPPHDIGLSIYLCVFMPRDLGMWLYANSMSFQK